MKQSGGAAEANRGLDPAWKRTHGTRTFFRPDPEMFEELDFSWELISTRMRESAYLNKGLWILLRDERTDTEKNFFFQGGVTSFVRHLNRRRDVLNGRPIYVERLVGSTSVEVALQYNDGFAENGIAFANNIHTVDGGTHVAGFRAALTTSLNTWARKSSTLSENGPSELPSALPPGRFGSSPRYRPAGCTSPRRSASAKMRRPSSQCASS